MGARALTRSPVLLSLLRVLRTGSCILLLAAAWSAAEGNVLHATPPDSAEHAIYVVGHGWHAGIVVSRGAIPEAAWPEQRDFPEATYLEVGWGDAAYYQHPDPGIWLALRAALWPTPSALHVVGMRRAPPAYFSPRPILRIPVTPDELRALGAFFHAAYARTDAGRAQPLGPGLYGDSRFYAGRERYHLFRNCNSWVARALREAGLSMSAQGLFTVGQLLKRVRRIGTAVPQE